MTDDTAYDKQRARSFLGTMQNIMNGGALALMCSIGHRTGLFDSMATLDAPATSAEIAAAADLDERYVREWLAAMAAGGIVDYFAAPEFPVADSPAAESTGAYRLPPEHQGLLTRAAGPLNLTTFCQYIGLLGQVEDEIVDAFRCGGGVPYDRYPDFHRVMAESSGQRYQRTLVDQVVPLLGGPARFESGLDVVDVGCGSGQALLLLGAAFPNSRFVGFDISAASIDTARAQSAEAGLANVSFEVRDAAALGSIESFDVATSFDAVHDQAHPKAMLAGIATALRPGGRYLCVEPLASSHLHENLDMAMGPLSYTVSTMHCMAVSLAYDGDGLGAMWGHQRTIEYLTEAGFVDIELTGVADDRSNNYFVAHKPA